jgi:DHA3 family macrolide efflux protein-like MFS transporter
LVNENITHWKPRFFTIWTGQAFSLFGSSLVQFALIWWLTVTTGSATVLATAALIGMLPQIVLSPFAGVVVDRASRRLVMLVADSLTALFTLVLVYLFAIGQAQVWHVYAIMFIRSATGAFHFPAMQASTTLMVPERHLSRVAGMNSALNGLMSIAAPAVGALLVSVWPMAQVMMIDVVTAGIAILPLLFITIPQPKRDLNSQLEAGVRETFLNDLREGVRYILLWRGLTVIVLILMSVNFLLIPAASLVPILVTKHYGSDAPQLAMAIAFYGIGIIAGGLLLSVWGGFKRRVFTSMMGLLIMGVSFAMLGLLPGNLFAAALVCAAGIGIGQPTTVGPLYAVLQATVLPAMQGRVMALIGALAGAITPISLLVAGPVADAIGVQVWYLVGGIVCFALGVAGFFIPALANIERDMKQQGLENEADALQSAMEVRR